MNAERLDRIEAAIEANAAAISELRSTVSSLVQIVEVHLTRNHEISQRNFETMVSEIRGLRTESQRILEHLFGQRENE